MAADRNAGAKFPCSGSVWNLDFCRRRSGEIEKRAARFMPRWVLASASFFSYAFPVKRPLLHLSPFVFEFFLLRPSLLAFFLLVAGNGQAAIAGQPQKPNDSAPAVTKVEPPSWWVGLTPEVMLLLSGHDLEATHVSCNLPTLSVSRTQSSAGGNYL